MFRNVNSSSRLTRMICVLSGSDSCLEWYSKLSCDDSSLESYSEVFDMASYSGFRNVARCQLLVCTPEFCSSRIPDKRCCKQNGRKLYYCMCAASGMIGVTVSDHSWQRRNFEVLNTRQPFQVRPSTSSFSRKGVRLSILLPLFCVSAIQMLQFCIGSYS